MRKENKRPKTVGNDQKRYPELYKLCMYIVGLTPARAYGAVGHGSASPDPAAAPTERTRPLGARCRARSGSDAG